MFGHNSLLGPDTDHERATAAEENPVHFQQQTKRQVVLSNAVITYSLCAYRTHFATCYARHWQTASNECAQKRTC